ncbi:hypothetical protein T484DRAFT_1965386 [Baffinella frigidus]|nr:hypothetical protein T484DRAFT_1965386 [Cryptophyta sp. CCMP2293]
MALPLEHVRLIASEEHLKEVYFNETSRLVSFARDSPEPGDARINVYYTTGTVGTCLDHPRQGKTQLFRRNVNLTMLREVFRDPRVHTDRGYQRVKRQRRHQCVICLERDSELKLDCGHDELCIQCTDRLPRDQDGKVTCPLCRRTSAIRREAPAAGGAAAGGGSGGAAADEEVPADEEAAARAQLQRLQKEAADIAAETADVHAIVRGFEKKREDDAAALEQQRQAVEAARAAAYHHEKAAEAAEILESKRSSRGKKLAFAGLPHTDHIKGIFSEDVVCIATDGNATITIYEHAAWAWTPGLPTALHNKLTGRQKTLPRPTIVALGSESRYYIAFADGQAVWHGPGEMASVLLDVALTSLHGGVRSVAFGEGFDTFFLVFNDGWWHAPGMPAGLGRLMESRKCRPDLKCVSLGPNGEWFLEAQNGRSWWGGVPEDFADFIANVKDRITFIDFGARESYLIRYN